MSFFLKDIHKHEIYSWDFLISDIKATTQFNLYCASNDFYSIFKNIVVSMLLGEKIVLLDADLTPTERFQLTGFEYFDEFDKAIDQHQLPPFSNKDDLLSLLKNPISSWQITLFTSGTTGVPKKVTHGFASVARFVKFSSKHQQSVWGFAYHPTHMAGLQVFLQALLNGSSIVRLFGLKQEEIWQEISKNGVTHLSATPTFYRLLLPCNQNFNTVLRLTSGGEKFNERTFVQLSAVFPNAKITNVYASTEAGSLFASENEVFHISKDQASLIKVVNDELMIHNSLMGISAISNDEWYATGDLVSFESNESTQFRLVSRKNEMINVGGYKVNPHEVEEAILGIDEIKSVRVYAKSNAVLGNVICCELVTDDHSMTEAKIRSYLQTKLQEFKIPRMIRFVDSLSTTKSGKIKRSES